MSQENVKTALSMLAAAQRGDWESATAPFDVYVELDVSRMPDGGVYKGIEPLFAFYQVSILAADLYIFNEGRIVRDVGFPDPGETLKAVGLEE